MISTETLWCRRHQVQCYPRECGERLCHFSVVFDGYKYTRNEVYANLEEQGITAESISIH